MYVARLEWKDITLLVKRQRKIVMLLNVFGSLQRRFWVTYVIHGQWFRPNFRPSRLYKNANLVVSSQIIIKGKGITPGWLVSLTNDFALNFRSQIIYFEWSFFLIIFFTSFSGHTPAQRESARTGLRGPFLESPVNFSGPKSSIQIEI